MRAIAGRRQRQRRVGNQLAQRGPGDRGRRTGEDAAHGRIGVGDAPGLVDGGDAVMAMVEDRAHMRLGGEQFPPFLAHPCHHRAEDEERLQRQHDQGRAQHGGLGPLQAADLGLALALVFEDHLVEQIEQAPRRVGQDPGEIGVVLAQRAGRGRGQGARAAQVFAHQRIERVRSVEIETADRRRRVAGQIQLRVAVDQSVMREFQALEADQHGLPGLIARDVIAGGDQSQAEQRGALRGVAAGAAEVDDRRHRLWVSMVLRRLT